MTFLQHIGGFFKTLLHIGEEVAVVAAPIVIANFPDVAPIYTSAIGLAMAAETTAATTTGTGPQKLAQVVSGLTPQVEAWAAKNGIVWDTADITKWTSALVDTLNMIPSPTPKP